MKTILILSALLSLLHVNAQEITNIVLVGPNGITDEIKKAESFIVIKHFPNYYERIDYKKGGPRIKSRSYKDSTLTTLEGTFFEYWPNGNVLRTGKYRNNKKSENWMTFSDSGKLVSSLKYEDDVLIETMDITKKDTAKKYDDQREAEFPGGLKAWTNYIIKSLKKTNAGNQVGKGGTVVLNFAIDVNGELQEPYIWKSVEFVLDEDSLEIIRKSPKWNPAWQNGHAAKSYYMQPIAYTMPE